MHAADILKHVLRPQARALPPDCGLSRLIEAYVGGYHEETARWAEECARSKLMLGVFAELHPGPQRPYGSLA